MTPPATAAAVPAVRPSRPARSAPVPARRRPAGAQRRARRVSGPARRQVRAVALAEAVAQHRLLDRLLRSRLWIAVVALALIGIVAMQLWVLKLNSGIGRAIEHEAYLQRANAQLAVENSSDVAGDAIEQQATASGMRLVLPGALRFLHARGPVDERQAAARLTAPVQATQAASAESPPSAVPGGAKEGATTHTSSAPVEGVATPTASAPTESNVTSSSATAAGTGTSTAAAQASPGPRSEASGGVASEAQSTSPQG